MPAAGTNDYVEVDVPDIGLVQFPADMSEDDITRAIQSKFKPANSKAEGLTLNEPESAPKQFGGSAIKEGIPIPPDQGQGTISAAPPRSLYEQFRDLPGTEFFLGSSPRSLALEPHRGVFSPDPNIHPLPVAGPQTNKVKAVAAALYNPLAQMGNQIAGNPLSVAPLMVTGGESAGANVIPKITEGIYAAIAAKQAPEALINAVNTAANPKASFQDKVSAFADAGYSTAMATGLATHIAKTGIKLPQPEGPAEYLAREIDTSDLEPNAANAFKGLTLRAAPLPNTLGQSQQQQFAPPAQPLETPNQGRSWTPGPAGTKRAQPVVVPETPPEAERGMSIIAEIQRAKADTTAKVQALFPEAKFTREQAAALRRQAFPETVQPKITAAPQIAATTPGEANATQKGQVESSVSGERAGDDKSGSPAETGAGGGVQPAAPEQSREPAEAAQGQIPLTRPPGVKAGAKEWITQAAYKDEAGDVFAGQNHPQILENLGVEGFESRESRNTPQFGYVTSKGRFVTRPQAAQIAEAAGQQLEPFDTNAKGEPQPHSDEIQSPVQPGKSIGEAKPLNPGGALKDLSPELQAKSNAVKEQMQGQLDKLKAQAERLKQHGDKASAAKEAQSSAMPAGPGAATRPVVTGEGYELPLNPGNPDVYGVAARVREERARAGQVAPVTAGEGIGSEESVEHGRDLLKQGADPEKTLADFEKTKKLSSEDMAIVRAQGEKLALAARRVEEKFGTDSDEYRGAFKVLSDWDKRTKAMQTEWHKTGQAQQGETDIDTGSFTGLQRAYTDATGKEFTPTQSKVAKKVAKNTADAQTAADKAREELFKFLKTPEGIPDDVLHKAVWTRVKAYVERGVDNFDDVRNKIATDLGLSVDKVTRLISETKQAKRLANDVWAKQQKARTLKEQAKRWVNNLSIPGYRKALNYIPRAMFSLKVGFHGTVALGTHAPMVAFQPRFWNAYVRDFGKMYRMVGSPQYYEQQVQDLYRRPNYITARRAGLVNDPFTYEDYTSPDTTAYFGRLTGMGNRGYSVLKILRQDMFDQHWNNLPETAQTPEVAKAVADSVNHATGVVKVKAPKALNVAFFAPRLEASRAAWLAVDPIKAADTFARWNKASESERHFAIMQVKEKAWVAGTMFSLLALNQGLLSATGSKQKINFTDPMKSDFLKFKVAGMDVSYGNPMITMVRLPVRLATIRAKGGTGKLAKLVYPDESMSQQAFDYARSQMSPLGSAVANIATKGDFENRPLPKMPLSGAQLPMPKRLAARGEKPYTWAELGTEQVLPIPAEEAVRDVWKNGFGMSNEQIKGYLAALAKATAMAGTGARLTDDTEAPK